MRSYEEIMEYLREKGVPRDILITLDKELLDRFCKVFEMEDEEETLQWLVDYLFFLDAVDNPNNYKRERTALTFASPVLEYLRRINTLIKTEDGRQYPLAYLVEDLVSWVLSDMKRFEEFVDDTYFREEGEEENEEESEEEKI